MNSIISPKIQSSRYTKETIYAVIEHLYEDDYFYHKKINWEDWIIMRMDILSVFTPKKDCRITRETITSILEKLNGVNHDL